jgi:threonine dehydrogenase-like Zn-dependent dehydrogenase
MKAIAALKAKKPAEISCVDIPMPPIGDYECLVRVYACGLCSSTDLKIAHGEHPYNPALTYTYPCILGHEAAGEIVETGRKVRYLKRGQRLISPLTVVPGCGYLMAYGGMTEYSVAADYRAMKEDGVDAPVLRSVAGECDFLTQVIPDDIAYTDAAMILTFKENYSAIKNFEITEGMDILIFGDGAVSMGISLFLRTFKVNSVIVAGHHDDRLERIGGVSKPDLLVNSRTAGIGELLGNRRFDRVIDAAGSIEIIKQGAGLLKPGGRVCLYGTLPKGKSALDLYDIPNNIGIQTLSYPYQEHRVKDEIIAFMRQGLVKAGDFYSHVLPAEQAKEAFRMVEMREAFKVILTF